MVTNDRAEIDRRCFENIYGRHLSGRELFEMKQNLLGFFGLLFEVYKRNQEGENSGQNEAKRKK